MADNYSHINPAFDSMRRLNTRLEGYTNDMIDFTNRQMAGEEPDPNEFARILEHRSVTKSAMQMQVKLHEKPLKTILQDVR